MNNTAVRYHSFGKPNEVLVLDELPLPTIGGREVLIKLLASPINPSDIGSILGKYGTLKNLPAVAGLEGIGEIVEVGSGVKNFKPGQRVRIPEEVGVWQDLCIANADSLRALPDNLPVETASMAAINPQTAICLLEEFADLNPGDWIIQNGANSNLGIAVIQYARKLGVRTVNVVRRESLKEPLVGLGADVVVTEEEPYVKKINELTGGSGIRLALNSIGGQSALNLLNCLKNKGIHVTYGAMTFDPIRFPTRQLIFQQVQIRGFWLHAWKSGQPENAARALDEKVYSLISDGTFRFPVEKKYPLSQFKQALEHHFQPRLGKILLVP